MSQFVVSEDGLISNVAAAEQAAWYVSRCPDADSIDFEAHIMLMRASAALEVDSPFANRGGVSKARYNVLRLLCAAEDHRLLMTEIVHGMSVSPTNITKLVDGLEKEDYVRRVDNLRDKRKIWVELTPKGYEAVEVTYPEVARHVKGLWSNLSTEEKRVLIHLLSKFRFGILTDAASEQVEWIARHPVKMPSFT